MFDSQSASSTKCFPCPPGSSNKEPGHPKCYPCVLGEYNPDHGKTECSLCPIHTYTNSINSIECIPCPANTYTTEKGSSMCLNCTFTDLSKMERCSGAKITVGSGAAVFGTFLGVAAFWMFRKVNP